MKYSLNKPERWMGILLLGNALILIAMTGMASITGSLNIKMFGVDVSGQPTLSSVVFVGVLSLILMVNGVLFICRPRFGWYLLFVLIILWLLCSVYNCISQLGTGSPLDLTFIFLFIILAGMFAYLKKKRE